jgi:hypothetical protein
LLRLAILLSSSEAWAPNRLKNSSTSSRVFTSSTLLQANLSPLPLNISPFEKSLAKSRDITGDFRKIAQTSLQQAMKDGFTELEIEFPPLLESKSQFDDFDNIQELNKNRDWCIEWLPTPSTAISKNPIWFVLPDTKEVELAKEEWKGQPTNRRLRLRAFKPSPNSTLLLLLLLLVLKRMENIPNLGVPRWHPE